MLPIDQMFQTYNIMKLYAGVIKVDWQTGNIQVGYEAEGRRGRRGLREGLADDASLNYKPQRNNRSVCVCLCVDTE